MMPWMCGSQLPARIGARPAIRGLATGFRFRNRGLRDHQCESLRSLCAHRNSRILACKPATHFEETHLRCVYSTHLRDDVRNVQAGCCGEGIRFNLSNFKDTISPCELRTAQIAVRPFQESCARAQVGLPCWKVQGYRKSRKKIQTYKIIWSGLNF